MAALPLQFDVARLQDLGRAVRQAVADNYKQAGIRVISGTLLRAVEQGDVQIQTSPDGFQVTVLLKDLQRPPRRGEKAPPTTYRYAPRVFHGGTPTRRVGPGFQFHGRGSHRAPKVSTDVYQLRGDQVERLVGEVADLTRTAVEQAVSDFLQQHRMTDMRLGGPYAWDQ